MYSNAVELCRQPAEQRADAPCKKRRQNAENEIFRHIQQIARNDDLPQPAVVQIERPDAGKVRNTDQVIYEEPDQPGDDRAAEESVPLPAAKPAANAAAMKPIV